MSAFTPGRWLPVILINAATGSPVRNPHSAVILLSTINAIREMIVCNHTVKLCSRLIVICGPVFSTIITDLGATIITDDHPVRIVRINPQVMVVSMVCIVGSKCFATVF